MKTTENRKLNAVIRFISDWAGVGVVVVCVLVIVSFLFGSRVEAREWANWCDANPDFGFHFYCDAAEEQRKAEAAALAAEAAKTPAPESEPEILAEPKPEAPPAAPAPTAMERLEAIQTETKEARALAILEPTPKNVANYMRMQKFMTDKASGFADTWRRVVWSDDDLSYTDDFPQSNWGKKISHENLKAKKSKVFAEFNERYALMYVGRSACGACQVYGPLLRDFASQHQLSVLAVSADTDGSRLTGWPEAVPNNGQLERLGLAGKPVPITMLFDRETKSVTLIGIGFLAQDELEERIYGLVGEVPGDAF